jgi:DNA-binding MarR family transcriptional regulator
MEADDHIQSGELASVVLMEAIVRDMYPLKASKEIQPLQWSILRYLEDNPVERCSLTLISQYVGLTAAPVGRAAKTLQDRGLIRHQPNRLDARTKQFVLSDAGREALKDDPVINVARKVADLSDEERAMFRKVMQKLMLAMRQPDEG